VKMKKIFLLAAILFGATLLAGSMNPFISFGFRGGMEYFLKQGDPSDYVAGINPFPVVPAHTKYFFGASIEFRISSRLAVEIGGEANQSSSITLIDPSDLDELTYNTASVMHFQGAIKYYFKRSRLSPYLLAGGAIDVFPDHGDWTKMTKKGYTVLLIGDHDEIMQAQVGAGIKYFLSRTFAVQAEARYFHFLKDPGGFVQLSGVILVCF